MKITNGAFVRKSLAVFSAAISLIAFISCGEDTGLGSTIDTEAPKIAISYPNPKVSNVARDEFVLAGTCSDDKLISRVQVAVTNLDTQTSYGTFPATLDAKSNTWSVKLNTFDASNEDNCNGYPFPDGNYKFVATAYDNAGHSTQDTSSFEIDNTAPVVVLESPRSITTATEYGSSFYVAGTITEEHTVSSLKVTIFDEAGNVLDQTDVTPYIENDIATSGGTNVSFMKFSTGSSTLRERYREIYGEDKNAGTKNYTCAIYASDNAKEFKNPGESSNTSGGNETPVFYLYSDVYKSLISSNGYKLSYADLMRIINGTYTASDDSARSTSGGEGLTSEQLAEVKAILAQEGQAGYDAEKSKATDTSEKHLKFSLNPKVNPTYTINGLYIDSSAGSYPSGNKGQVITYILSPGLDGTLIEAATVKAWLLKCKGQEEGLSEEDYADFLSDPANYNGATKILDLSEKYDSDTMLSDLTSTFTLPEITANYFYIVAISGVDADGNELIPDGTFGFIGALSGTPPKVTIETPAKQAIIGSSADITFSGSVVTTDVELESIDISFDVTNLADGTSLTTSESEIKLVASGSGKEGDSVTWAEPEYNSATSKYTYTWTCNLRDCDNYELFSAEKGSGKIYSYTATVKATDISGNYAEGNSMVTADTLPPVITVSSLLPSVSDYTDENHADENVVYVNGNITISGTIYDDNLKTAYYTVLVNGETVKDEAGNDDEDFTKVTIPNTQFKINVDTTKLEDDSKFDILIYAEDRANASSSSTITTVLSDEEGTGNNTSVNVSETDLYDDGVSLRILQETDRPVISLTNASSSITDYDGIIAAVKDDSTSITNIFSKNGTLNAIVSDDDGIESVKVEYSSDSTNYKELASKYSASNNTLSATLSLDYGEYNIRITARDKKGLDFGSAESNFYVAVDDGIPTFSGVQPADGNYYSEGFTVSGSVKDASGQVSLKLKDELNGSLANAEGADETSASISGNSGVKNGAQFKDTVKVPSESGTYTLTYIASDKYLQESEYSISYTVDKDNPILSDFAGFENGGNLGTKAPTISVKASDDLSGLAKVSVYDGNGSEIAQLSGVEGLYQGVVSLSEGNNSICVKAFDKAGNETRLPESGFYTVTVDTVAPTIENPLLSIKEINAENYGSADFDGVTVTATVTDIGSGAKYAWLSTSANETSYSESASSIKAENKNADLTAEWNVSLLIPKAAFSDGSGARDGQYTFYLYAEDAAQKASDPSALTFVVDTTAPEFTVSVLKDGKKSFTQNDVSDLDESKTSAKYSLSGSWKDLQTGTASLQYATSANPEEDDWIEISNTNAANIALSWNATIYVHESQGNSLSFRARDKARNVSAVTTYSDLIFDFSAPSITLNSTIPSQTKDSVTVAGSVSDSLVISKENILVKAVKGSTVLSATVSEVTEKEGKEYSYSLEIPATEENNGTWTISFEATDEAGQKTTLPSKTVTLDTSVPTLSYDWTASPATASGSSFDSGNKTVYFNGSKTLTVNIEAKDNDGGVGLSVVEYNILSDRKTEWAEDGAQNGSWSSLSKVGSSDVWKATIISDFADLTDGSYTIFIRSSDELGNEAYAEPLYLVSDKTSPVLSETVASGKSISSAGLSYEAGNFSLSGSITDDNLASLEYTLDGGVPASLTVNNGVWSIENDSVTEEDRTFAYVITATDKAGNTAKLIRTIKIDKTAPKLSLDAWKDSDGDEISNKNSGTVTFSGSVSDESVSDESDGSGLDSVKVWYTINSEKVEASVSPDSDGKWTYTFTNVAEGSYTIYALAKDKAGNEKQVQRDFGVDLTKPESSLMVTGTVYDKSSGSPVALSEASDHSGKWDDGINYLAKEAFTLSGIISDEAFRAKNVRLTVKKDGGAETNAELALSKADGTEIVAKKEISSLNWSYTQNVAGDHSSDGLYTYKLSVTDDAGNAASYSFIVRVDTTAPNILSVDEPESYSIQNGDTINLSGNVSDAGSGVMSVSYVIKNTTVTTEPDVSGTATLDGNSWSKEITGTELSDGVLSLNVTASDYLGNKKELSPVLFYKDTTAPNFGGNTISTEKTAEGWYKNSTLSLSVNVSDTETGISRVTYKVGDGSENTLTPGTGDNEGVYSSDNVVCAEGENIITITATNKAGLSSETTISSIKVDTTSPTVSSPETSSSLVNKANLNEESFTGLAITSTVKDAGSGVAKVWLGTGISETYETASYKASLTSEQTSESRIDGYAASLRIPKSALALTDGTHTYYLFAQDETGRTTVSSPVQFTVDTTAPVVTVSNLASNAVYTENDVTNLDLTASARSAKYKVSGTWTDAVKGTSTLEYSTDGGTNWTNVTGLQSASGVTMSWSATIDVAEGSEKSIKFRAKDLAGNISDEADYTFSGITFDFSVPVITFDSYVEKTNSTFILSGTVSDVLRISSSKATITATKDGTSRVVNPSWTPVTEDKSYRFSVTVPASSPNHENDGQWEFTVNASDEAGRNAAVATASSLIDTKAPELETPSITIEESSKVSDITYFNQSNVIDFKIDVKDDDDEIETSGVKTVQYAISSGHTNLTYDAAKSASPSTIVADWAKLSEEEENSWEATIKALQKAGNGEYVIFVRATDFAGNTADSSVIKLLADNISPVISETDNIDKYIAVDEDNKFELSGTVSDTHLTAVTSSATVGNDSDSAESVVWDQEANTWKISQAIANDNLSHSFTYAITAKDLAGNTTTHNKTVYVDRKSPTVAISTLNKADAATNNFVNSANCTFAGSSSDDLSGISSLTGYLLTATDATTINESSGEEAVMAKALLSSAIAVGSGVNAAASWNTTFTIESDGSYVPVFVAADVAGNTSVTKGSQFTADFAAPKSTLALSNVYELENSSAIALTEGNYGDAISEGKWSSGKWTDGYTYYAKDDFTLSGTVSDIAFNSDKISLTVNNVSQSLTKTTTGSVLTEMGWSYNQTLSSDTTYTYKLTLEDNSGNKITKTFIVQSDKSAPSVSILAPAAGSNQTESSFTVSGTVNDGSGIGAGAVTYEIYKDNTSGTAIVSESATIDGGSWSATVSNLNTSGNLILVARAIDYLGNSALSSERSFYRDSTAPAISSPSMNRADESAAEITNGGWYNSSSIALSATASDSESGVSSVTYKVKNGSTVGSETSLTLSGENANGKVVLSEGTNEITITATNNVALSATENLTIKIDTTKPVFNETKLYKTSDSTDKTAVSVSNEDVTIAGTLTEENLAGTPLSVTATKDGVAADISSSIEIIQPTSSNSNWSVAVPSTIVDGSWVFTITAADLAGNTSSTTATVRIDTTKPKLSTPVVETSSKTKDSGEKWYKTTELRITGTTIENGSGLSSVSYQTSEDGTTWSNAINFDGTSSWDKTISGFKSGTTRVKITALDKAGNEAEAVIAGPFNIDTKAPELTADSVKVGGKEVSESSPYYSNGKADAEITFSVTDSAAGSGVEKVYVVPYESVSDETAVDENKATLNAGTASITITKEKFTKSGTMYARIYDYAGNYADVNLFALTYDATDPKIQSYALSDNTSGFTAYNSGKDSAGNAVYYVNNGDSHTFTLSGIATDNLGLSSAVLSINGTKIKEITDEDSLSSYSFDSINLSSYSGDAAAKITLTDKAGNTAEQAFTIKLDTAAPQGSHDTDSANQDYIFRIGSGTGGKYSAGTYGNASTIQIRGYFNETGSGTNMIYYKLFSGSTPTAADATTFLSSYESSATGYFSPLSSEETAEVSSSADSTTKTVKTNFKSNISGFQEGNNYLLLVAVDNVGNADLDNVTYEYTDESSQSVSVKGCYSINVDTTTPVFDKESESILTNGEGEGDNANIVIEGYVTDAAAGIDSVAVSVTVGTSTASATVETEAAATDVDANRIKWTATLAKSAFSSVTSGTYTVYAKATDKAGEGNSQTVAVANVTVDKVAPTVTLTKPTTADSSKTDNTYINGTISLSGTIKDANTLPDTAITGIQVSKDNSTWTSVTSDSSDSENIVMDSFTFEGNYTFSVSGFDTTKLDDETEYYIRAVAIDAAGNTGYSDGVKVKVSQDTDRPVIKITNLSVTSDGSYILKYGTDSQIMATVTDDDGIDSVVISGSSYTGSESLSGGSVYTASTGTVTFTPADTADGTKTFYVYVKDSERKEFYTTAAATGEGTESSPYKYLSNPKIFVANTDIGNTKEASAFTYVSDSTSPVVGTVDGLAYKSDGTTVNGGYNSETAGYTKYETVGASYVIGGSERQQAIFRIAASDANGIAGMTAELSYKDSDGNDVSKKIRTSSLTDSAYSEYTENGSLVVSADDSTSATWTTTDLISLADAATGSITLTVTPYDKSGLSGNGTFTFVADQSGPSIKVTSPSTTEHVSGSSILVSGIATDVGGSSTSTIQWGIPNASGEIENWQGELTATSSVSAWSFNFDGNSNASFDEFTDKTNYKVSESSDIWTIPVYFKASDLLGNETVYDGFSLLYDPDADRPQTTLSYPGEADKKSGEDYAILGGTIRTTGSVEIPDGSTSVWAVYMQISDDNGEFGTADKTRASNAKAVSDGEVAPTGYGYEVVDADSMEANWQTANSNTGSLNFHSTDSSKNSSYRSSWWGIKVTKNSGSWYVNLNSSGELNSNVSGSTNNIKVRFCGVSSEGKVGHWTEPYSIHIDSNVPKYTTAMYKYSGDISSVSDLYGSATSNDSDSGIVTASKIKPYEADMYLKGQWYAFAKITDESSVKITGVKRGTTSLTYGSDYFVYPESAGNAGESSTGSELRVDSSDSASYVAYVWVKIDPAYTTTQTYTITAKDSDGTPNFIYPAFELNTDNTAPTVTALTDTSGSAISMTKLRNSDHGITFETSATDTGSGFDKLLFYFKRTITSNSTATTTIELPLPSGTSGSWTTGSDAAYVGTLTETDSDLDEGNELYGVKLSGTSSSDGSTTTFTASSDISSYKFIRKGGVIKLSGVYYVISDVNGNAITVDSAVSGSPTTAFAAAAMVLDHVSTAEGWTWTNGSFKVAGDEDDDGFVEFIKKSGSTWTCEATIMGNQLEDGPISLVTVAFDKAENVTTTTTNVMIANNTPRLAKVFLATDLNGDAKFTDNEFGSSTIKNLNQTYKFYSALTNGTEGSAREVVTLSQSNDGVSTGLTMRDSLAAAFEFVSGDDYEGYGSGNGDLYYKLDVGTSALTEAQAGSVSADDGKKLTKLDSMSEKFASVSDIEIGSTAVSAKALTGLVITPANITSGIYGSHSECTASETPVTYIGLTLWDSTKGTTPGVGDTVSGGKITAFGSQSTVVNIPIYIDLTDDVDPNPTFADPTAHTDGGHVELSATLPSATFPEDGSAEYDRDTKISGKVVFTGSVSDEKRVSSIKLTSGKAINSTLTSAKEVASYDTTNGLLKVTDAASETDGWTFAITETTADAQFSVTDGHKVTWTLTLDSSYVEGVAASDVLFTLTASDGTNGADAEYQVDIVPYITGIVRGNTTISGGTMNRSNIGRYPVAEGETLKVSGYNLDTSGSWTVGTNNDTTSYDEGTIADDGTYSFMMTVPERSGNLSVTVNNISSLNNDNDNTQENNKESFKMSGTSTVYSASDNRYLSVWNLGNYFNSTDGGYESQYPVMTADKDGNLRASWGAISNSNIMFSQGLTKAAVPIYRNYDQPAPYSGVAIDTKSGNATYLGSAVVTFIQEHGGNGNSFSRNGLSSAVVDGGAAAVQINKTEVEGTMNYSGMSVQVTGNPKFQMDGTNYTAFYNLASYDANRRFSSFENPHSARYGKYTHSIWYDNVTEGLKYSVVDVTDGNFSNGTGADSGISGAIAGWVVLDGGYTGQDRMHIFTKTGGSSNTSLHNNNRGHVETGASGTYANYSTDVFLATGVPNNSATGNTAANGNKVSSNYISAATATSITTQSLTVTLGTDIKEGDTIALLDNYFGNFKIEFRTITNISDNVISWKDDVDFITEHGGKDYLSAAIYHGDMNVVSTATKSRDFRTFQSDATDVSSSAGSSAAIDVMTNGYPVVAYYDAANSKLKVVVAKAQKPSTAANWTRLDPNVKCSGEVSMKLDGGNNIHIMYNNEDGQMCYLYGTYNDGSYTWGTEEVVDENGSLSYGSISVVYDGSSYVPAMTYLNKANTANGVKYAYRTVAPAGDTVHENRWDFMIIPALGNGHYALKENKISLESSNNWTNKTVTVLQNQLDTTQPKTATPATVDSVIAYKTSKAYETAYLKKE